MVEFLIGSKSANEVSQIKVKHFYIDFRIMNLGFKLAAHKIGEEVEEIETSDYDLSLYLFRICKIYGSDIDFQDSTRNLIDSMYENVYNWFSIQFLVFFFGYLFPLILQIFVVEQRHFIKACQITCLFTMCIFVLHALIQIWFQKKEYFQKITNINELVMFFCFALFFGLKFYDNRNYLPEII
jgi:hypothetical protein